MRLNASDFYRKSWAVTVKFVTSKQKHEKKKKERHLRTLVGLY